MICFIRSRNTTLYKRTLEDAWGHHWIYRKFKNWTAVNYARVMKKNRKQFKAIRREFTLNITKRIYYRKRKRERRWYFMPRFVKAFYLILTSTQFRRYKRAATRRSGYFMDNFLCFLEGRLFMVVYRANYVTNIFMIKKLINKGLFYVNKKIRLHPNFVVKKGDFVGVIKKYRKLVRKDLLLRFKHGVIFFRPPHYYIYNYWLMFIIMREFPKLKSLIFPSEKINIFAAMEFFNPYH